MSAGIPKSNPIQVEVLPPVSVQVLGSITAQPASNDPPWEEWRAVRSVLEHEDNLTDQRIRWLLTGEGLIIGFFFTAEGALLAAKAVAPAFVLAVNAAFGITFFLLTLLCYPIAVSISSAGVHIEALRLWWMSRWGSEDYQPREFAAGFGTWFKWLRRQEPFDLEHIVDADHGEQVYAPTQAGMAAFLRRPPIMGRFAPGRLQRTTLVPLVVAWMNIAICLFCLMISLWSGWCLGSKPKESAETVNVTLDPSSLEALGNVERAADKLSEKPLVGTVKPPEPPGGQAKTGTKDQRMQKWLAFEWRPVDEPEPAPSPKKK